MSRKVIVRCKHCGNHYTLQLSGIGFEDYNSDRSDDYCPECYAIIKDELNSLENKLHCKEMQEHNQRYKHAYVKTDDITLDDVLNFCKANYSNTNFLMLMDGVINAIHISVILFMLRVRMYIVST